MAYVDGFLLTVPSKQLAAYRKMATKASKVWTEYGAIQYVETVGDDLKIKGLASFAKAAGAKKGETVIFSWVMWKSKAARNAANKKIMADPRIGKMMAESKVKMDMKRMCMGGVQAGGEQVRTMGALSASDGPREQPFLLRGGPTVVGVARRRRSGL